MSIAAPSQGYLQVKMSGSRGEPEPGSDSAVLASGCTSMTPLQGVCEALPDGLPWPATETADTHPAG